MKQISKIAIIALSATSLSACNFLDFDQAVGYNNQQEVYEAWTRAEESLTNVYSYLDADFGSIGNAMRDCATDDAYYVWTQSAVHDFSNGKWSALNTIDEVWGDYYSAIRSANQFIKNFQETDYSRYEWNSDYKTWCEKSQYWVAEARFLRSYFLFELAKRYGDIPLATGIYTESNVNELTKTSFANVIDYIVAECSEISKTLPMDFSKVSGSQTGRATKGAALALKSRALLYASSPLFSADNKDKWIEAANAAKEVMDLHFYQLVNEESVNNLNSKELIFERRMNSSCDFEKKNFPISFDKGNTGACPSQNLVDAFQTNKGFDVTLSEDGWHCDDPSFDPKYPYANRDKRFYKTVIYNESIFKGREIACYEGGSEGLPVVGASETGYYLKKYIIEDVDLSPVEKPMIHTWVLFRYAEILLNYAEAMNKAYGPDATGDGLTMTAREALNLVRARASMTEVPETITDSEDFHKFLIREKRVEFAMEGHRFWDVRRWKIGKKTQETISGVHITKAPNGTKTYSKILVESRTWADKKYLYPIPMTELYKNNNLYPQNQGW